MKIFTDFDIKVAFTIRRTLRTLLRKPRNRRVCKKSEYRKQVVKNVMKRFTVKVGYDEHLVHIKSGKSSVAYEVSFKF